MEVIAVVVSVRAPAHYVSTRYSFDRRKSSSLCIDCLILMLSSTNFEKSHVHICLGPTRQSFNVEFYVNNLLLVFVCKRMLESVSLSVNSKTSPRIS
jgi:hypothetical protein